MNKWISKYVVLKCLNSYPECHKLYLRRQLSMFPIGNCVLRTKNLCAGTLKKFQYIIVCEKAIFMNTNMTKYSIYDLIWYILNMDINIVILY